ncbi:response regulator [Alkalibaculum sp. M08DMB]|uniref:Stage 0 sporulation protein A homolog n=1 Tax=Alkalibaculum sporogenes TaxID=2655001 RepID=A0A6A7KBQ5_9FIRM|nr:response regulator [Alkalibaculum sporogenes]MPW26836.1 response regulator [Alkalibaculum sporogenes]
MNKFKECILVVEDDTQIRNFICYSLKQEGLNYLTSGTAQGALGILVSEQIDLMLLDLGLPDFDGMDVIKKVREWSEIPIIVISARDQDKEKAAALDTGADDYLTKPFFTTELMARIRVAIRHLKRQNGSNAQSIISVSGLSIDLEKHLVFLNESEIHTTPLEYKLLALFFKNIGKVLTTGYIIKEIWGVGYGTDTQALRALMSGLRRKIENNPAKPRYIITEIGIGYRLKDE